MSSGMSSGMSAGVRLVVVVDRGPDLDKPRVGQVRPPAQAHED